LYHLNYQNYTFTSAAVNISRITASMRGFKLSITATNASLPRSLTDSNVRSFHVVQPTQMETLVSSWLLKMHVQK